MLQHFDFPLWFFSFSLALSLEASGASHKMLAIVLVLLRVYYCLVTTWCLFFSGINRKVAKSVLST